MRRSPGTRYDSWRADNVYLVFDGITRGNAFLQTFVEYPPSQPPASFSIDQIEEAVKKKIAAMQQTKQRVRPSE